MNRLTRYIVRQELVGLALAGVIILLLIGLIDFVELSRSVGDARGVGLTDLIPLTVLRAPSLMETTFPFIFLFGTMWAISRLNKRSELIAMRAGGMSAWMFLRPILLVAIVGGVLLATLVNPGAASLYGQAERAQDRLENLGQPQIVLSQGGVWLREAREDVQLVIRARSASERGRVLEGVTAYLYDRGNDGVARFTRRFDAERARLTAGFWQLQNVRESEPGGLAVRHSSIALETRLEPDRVIEREGGSRALTFWQLPGYAQQLETAGFTARDYWLRWWKLVATPLVLAAMGTIGVAVSLSLTRSGGTGRLAIVGVATGFAVYFADNMVAAFAATGITPAFVSAFIAPLLAFLGGLYALALFEDG